MANGKTIQEETYLWQLGDPGAGDALSCSLLAQLHRTVQKLNGAVVERAELETEAPCGRGLRARLGWHYSERHTRCKRAVVRHKRDVGMVERIGGGGERAQGQREPEQRRSRGQGHLEGIHSALTKKCIYFTHFLNLFLQEQFSH